MKKYIILFNIVIALFAVSFTGCNKDETAPKLKLKDYNGNPINPVAEYAGVYTFDTTILMFTKYCPMKRMNQCGICKTKSYELKDEHGTFPIITHDDCTTTILNGKILNLLDEVQNIKAVEAFRLNFTVESKEQVIKTINMAMKKLKSKDNQIIFNKETDTRGHFNKEIM